MSKQNALAELMVKLSLDPALRHRFQDEPAQIAGEAGLSDEELELVAGGDPDAIRAYLGNDAPVECFVMFAGGLEDGRGTKYEA